ncbi:MAG: hypothetical protein KAI83_11330 [Thiomargarita sp.]|nr:hypothetical protein [Thiomargarita sp.]
MLIVEKETAMETLMETLNKFRGTLKQLIVYGVFLMILLVIAFLLHSSVFKTESGYIYHSQDMIMRKIDVYDKPGFHFKIPFSYQVTRYVKAWTVSFGIAYDGQQIRSKEAIQVRFADTYTAGIPATFRFKLPANKENIKMIHQEFRSFGDLIDSLLIKTARDVVVNTATQYTGEEFYLGGFNEFKAALADQLRNGIYKTVRKRILEDEQPGSTLVRQKELQKTKTWVWKTIPVLDEKGNRIRLDNPLNPYGIEVTQITLGEPKAEPQLGTLLAEKKRLVAERIKAVQAQETSKEQAITAQLEIEVERARESQLKMKEKELALIDKQREVEEAQKQAEKEIVEYKKTKSLAAIDKAKELAIQIEEEKIKLAKKAEELAIVKANEKIQLAEKAKELAVVEAEMKIQLAKKVSELAVVEAETKVNLAKKAKELAVAEKNKDIQKANFESAQFEAKAIEEKGVAEANVLKAKYDALKPDIYLAEIQRDIAHVVYPNLKDMKLTMPHNIVNLGNDRNNSLQTNLDVLSNFATISVMEWLEKNQEKSTSKDETSTN